MAINLADIGIACQDYLNQKVSVSVSDPQPGPGAGAQLNPNDAFTFAVTAVNAAAAAGGVTLTNVRYRIQATPRITLPPTAGNNAKLKVPSQGQTTDLAGNPLNAGDFVSAMIHRVDGDLSLLNVGESDVVLLEGKAGPENGGAFIISARVIADFDENVLFLKGEDSNAGQAIKAVQPV